MKNLKSLSTLVAAMILVATTTVTFAQFQGGGPNGPPSQGGQGGPGSERGPRRGNNAMFVVRMSTVQQHLQLTGAQVQAINELRPPRGGQGGPGAGGPGGGGGQGGPGAGGPGGGGGQGGPGAGGPGGPGGPGDGGPLAEILNENQMRRLQQLTLQFDAPMTFLDPRSSRELNLTAQQRQQIEQAIRANMPQPNPEQRPTFAQMQAAKQSAFTAAWSVLNGQQKQKWGQMTGQAFTNWVEPPRPPQNGN